MNIATTSTVSELRAQLVRGVVPMVVVVSDPESDTRVEIDKDNVGNETIVFRTQGDRLAVLQRPAEGDSSIRLFPMHPDTDMELFWTTMDNFYLECPELKAYIRANTDKEEVLGGDLTDYDRDLLVTIFGFDSGSEAQH